MLKEVVSVEGLKPHGCPTRFVLHLPTRLLDQQTPSHPAYRTASARNAGGYGGLVLPASVGSLSGEHDSFEDLARPRLSRHPSFSLPEARQGRGPMVLTNKDSASATCDSESDTRRSAAARC